MPRRIGVKTGENLVNNNQSIEEKLLQRTEEALNNLINDNVGSHDEILNLLGDIRHRMQTKAYSPDDDFAALDRLADLAWKTSESSGWHNAEHRHIAKVSILNRFRELPAEVVTLLQQEIEEGAPTRGVNLSELLALVHSEVSEALESYRNSKLNPCSIYSYSDATTYPAYPAGNSIPISVLRAEGEVGYDPTGKTEGVASELADVIIRIFDISKRIGIPTFKAMKLKMQFNMTRSYRHGGKRL